MDQVQEMIEKSLFELINETLASSLLIRDLIDQSFLKFKAESQDSIKSEITS